MRPTFALGGLALAVLVAGSGLALALRDDAPPTVQVRLAAAQRGQVTATVSAAGSTVDGSRRNLAFGSSGTLTKVYVKVGTKVKKGQVLARIDGRAAREAYTAAKADLAAAEEALDEAQVASGSTPAACTPSGSGTTAANGELGPAAPSALNPNPVPTSTPHSTATPTTGPTDPGPEPQPTVTVTVTATVTTTVTATPTGGPDGGTPTGGGPDGGTPTGGVSDGTTGRPGSRPTPTGSAKPSAGAKPSPSGKPTGSGRPSAQPSGRASGRPGTKPTGAARPSSQSSCGRGTGTTGQGTGTAGQGTGMAGQGTDMAGQGTAGQGGISEEQAAANVDRAEAALEQAADGVRATRIVAPAAGTVLSVAGAAGDTAGTGTFISLGNLNELQVQAMVTESDVNRLKLGQKAQITLATRNGERHQGTVTAIAPTATVDGQLVRYSVTLAFDEPPTGLMLGQTASVTVTTGEAEDAIYVPAAAVRSRSDGTQVVTVRSGGRDSAKVVRTGVRGDQYVQVTSGLRESEEVVMSGTTSGEFPDASWPGA
ncbi:efflux RND transporter periplasmic adaptor subunit [Nonomuraea sp. NPDC049400]|uniref:efflux RND transporter periplasmic adaptor subunit n=1 Tax=Nonomuraea sp. NPDC049400 TaxID=3364352 RepID=UPI00378B9D89